MGSDTPRVGRQSCHRAASIHLLRAYLTVGDDTITWAYGHLVSLADPEHYHEEWKRWSWTTLPMIPDRFELQPIPKTAAHLKHVITLIKRADRIIVGGDPDREGQIIADWVLAMARVNVPIDPLDDRKHRERLSKSLENDETQSGLSRIVACCTRTKADWLIGLNATRAFSLRHGQPGQPLSVGRVQTPTLQLVVDRDRVIYTFSPQPYWELHVTFAAAPGTYVGIWQGPTKEHPARIMEETSAQTLATRIPSGTPGIITEMWAVSTNIHTRLAQVVGRASSEHPRKRAQNGALFGKCHTPDKITETIIGNCHTCIPCIPQPGR